MVSIATMARKKLTKRTNHENRFWLYPRYFYQLTVNIIRKNFRSIDLYFLRNKLRKNYKKVHEKKI